MNNRSTHWWIKAFELGVAVEELKIGILSGPGGIFETCFPRLLDRHQRVVEIVHLAKSARAVVENHCVVGTQNHRHVTFSLRFVKPSLHGVVTSQQDACTRVLRHLLYLRFIDGDLAMSKVREGFLLP